MNSFLLVLVIVNVLWSIYLTFIIYRKIGSSSRISPEVQPNSPTIKIGLNRFNPFQDIGGDQSFVLCLLDNHNSGAIITSLHNRDTTRVYAKHIINGQSDQQSLSSEESRLLAKTISN